jgi:hypothetical protein
MFDNDISGPGNTGDDSFVMELRLMETSPDQTTLGMTFLWNMFDGDISGPDNAGDDSFVEYV